MHFMRVGVSALALGLLASSCNTTPSVSGAYAAVDTTPEALTKRLTDISAKTYKLKGKKEAADVEGVLGALPEWLSVTHGDVSFDAPAGATVVHDLKIALSAFPTAGLGVAELKLFGFDADFAKARLAGERLNETGRLAARMDATNISAFGLETLFQPAMDAYMAGVADAVEGVVGDDLLEDDLAEINQAAAINLTHYNLSIGRIVMDDVVLRPFTVELKNLGADSELAEIFPYIQQYAAYARSFAADTIAYYDIQGDLTLEEPEVSNTMHIAAANYGLRGLRGGDTDLAILSGLTYSANISAPELDAPIVLSGTTGRYEFEGLRLDKALDHLARGVMPERTVSDFISLGKSRTLDGRFSLNGQELYAVKSTELDLSKWRWLVPTSVSMSVENETWNIPGFLSFIRSVEPEIFADDPDVEKMVDGVVAALGKYELDKPSFDYGLSVDWNDTSGKTDIAFNGGIDDFMHFDATIMGSLPSFDAVSDLIPENPEEADQQALATLFAASSLFEGFEYNLKDEGGLDKTFALTIDIAKLVPDEDGQMAMLTSQTPDGLRQMAASLVYLGSGAAAAEFPPAQDLLRTVAAWIQDGGSLRLKSSPEKPLGAAAAAMMQAMSPISIYNLFNITLTHEAPKGAAKAKKETE
ncbi:MAG: hypothetical protein R3C52_10410 [Hyphomonadaceae bacterium]